MSNRNGNSGNQSFKSNNSYQNKSNSNNRTFYDCHLSAEKVNAGLLAGTLFRGCFKVNPKKRKVGYVSCDGLTIDICIDDDKLRNRAIQGDIVAIELLPKSEWLSIKQRLALTETVDLSIDEVNDEFAANWSGSFEKEEAQKEEEVKIQQELWQPRAELLVSKREENKDVSAIAPIVVHEVDEYSQQSGLQPRGRIVGIIMKSHVNLHIGALKAQCDIREGMSFPESESFVYFNPADQRFPNLIIHRMQLPEAYIKDPFTQQKQIYLSEISESWPDSSRLPIGCNIRSVGEMGSIQAETEALLIANNLNHGFYTDEQLKPLNEMLALSQENKSINTLPPNEVNEQEKINWEIPEEEIKKRRDLRSYRIFTIDPPNAKDLDDALHVTQLDDDTFEIGVHIADVSYFLKEGTLLDVEARKRATSVYLVQKVIPMLPSILCEQLCSLNPNVDRLAFSCIFKMKSNGNLVNEKPYFGRTVIRSCAKLDYPTAQRMIDGLIPSIPSEGVDEDAFLKDLPEHVWESKRRPIGQVAWKCSNDVNLMNKVAMNRRAIRMNNGALTLFKPKAAFRLDANGNPSEFNTYVMRDSNRLVEEYMLLANYLVAQEMLTKNGKAAFLRNHRVPDPEYLKELKVTAERMGVSLDISSAKTLQESLLIAETLDPAAVHVLSTLLLHPMKLALYLCVGETPCEEWKHFALSIPYYTHFTSPIRRYADVMVHRLLDLGLVDEEKALNEGNSKDRIIEYTQIADSCNVMRLNAKKAQERSDEVFLAIHLVNNPMYVDAIVIGIGEKSFSIIMKQLGEESRLFIDEMDNTSSSFEEDKQVITLIKGGVTQNKYGNNQKFQHPKILNFNEMKISMMTRVVVYCTANMTVPIGVRYSLVCLGTCVENGLENTLVPI